MGLCKKRKGILYKIRREASGDCLGYCCAGIVYRIHGEAPEGSLGHLRAQKNDRDPIQKPRTKRWSNLQGLSEQMKGILYNIRREAPGILFDGLLGKIQRKASTALVW